MKTNVVASGEGKKLEFGAFRAWVKDDGTLTEEKSGVMESFARQSDRQARQISCHVAIAFLYPFF